MTLKDKLFIVRDDQPYLNPVGINVPEFKKLWEADKTEEKAQYAKELAYIFHMCDYQSPYFDIDNKHEEVAKAYMGGPKYKPTKRVTNAIEMYKKMQYGPEHRALDAAVALGDSLTETAMQANQETTSLSKLLEKIDVEAKLANDVYTEMALAKEKLDIRKQSLDIAKASTDLIGKIDKNIDSLLMIRRKVTTATYQSADNPNSIDKFLIDEFLE
jgi:hypothetical protein